MTESRSTFGSLIGVVRVFRQMLGRRIYLLVLLAPFAALSEGFGIALLMPLFSIIGAGEEGLTGGDGHFLDWLPLPSSPPLLLLLIAAAFFVKAALKTATESLRAYFQAGLTYQLSIHIIQSYTDLSYLPFTSRNTGHYVNVATAQVNRFAQAFGAIFSLLMQIAAAAVYMGILALANWQFASVAVTAGLVFVFSMRILSRYVASLSRKTAAEKSILNKQLVQVVHSLKYLVATFRAEHFLERVRESCGRLFRYQLHTGLAQSFSVSIREPLSVSLVLFLIAVQIYFLEQPVGAIVVTLLLLDRGTKAMLTVQNSWQRVSQLIGSVEIIQDELEFAAEEVEHRGEKEVPRLADAVEFQDVCFAYDADEGDVLKSVSLRFPRNQTVAIVGRSGAGKSTVADLLTMLLRPSSGQMRIDGVDVAETDPRTWRRQLGYVCQETIVFDDTVAMNICLEAGAWQSDPDVQRRVREAAKQAFASEFIESLPDGFETIVGDRGVRLSGGQRQRLFIARELYKRPSLLILDEATSALDGESESAIQASVDALRGQVTVVVIAHRLSTIRNADYIYVLDDGHVVEHGSYEDLHKVEDSQFRRMVELQSL